jgi:transcriptional regulator with XRE-family HTH domain
MSELKREELIENFLDKEYRESYAEDYLNTTIATQLRIIREQRELTQAELAAAVGTKQTAISRIENVNNAARNIGTLEAIAFALGCRLKVSFETFGSLIDESLYFSRESLQRPSFDEDPVFLGTAPAVFLVGGTNPCTAAVSMFGPSLGVLHQDPNAGVMFAANPDAAHMVGGPISVFEANQGYPNTGVMFAANPDAAHMVGDPISAFAANLASYSSAPSPLRDLYGNVINAPIRKNKESNSPNQYSLAA